MPKPDFQDRYPLDPIEYEHRKQARRRRLLDLFHPVFEGSAAFDRKWLVHNWIPEGSLVMLAGEPKVGKTCLATAIAIAVATGTPFAGMPTVQSSVLWLSAEESPVERMEVLQSSRLVDFDVPVYTCYEPLWIDSESGLEDLEAWRQKTDARLLVVDPLLGAISGRSIADSWGARKSLQALKRWCSVNKVTALVLHHPKRIPGAGRLLVADNAQISATASMWIVMAAKPAVGCPGRMLTLECRGRGAHANRVLHLVSEGPLDFHDAGGVVPSPDRDAPYRFGPIDHAICDALKEGPLATTDLYQSVDANVSTIRNHIVGLRRNGIIDGAGLQGRVRVYELNRENYARNLRPRNAADSGRIGSSEPAEKMDMSENGGGKLVSRPAFVDPLPAWGPD